ncbi:MAG: hypothetical protein KKE72_05025 [Gammaproteobacteria bacterium]|nr:hypothetical protein [Gammaproteobacteria bacterium]MBU2204044.1 hypothetical protein [Gammaproteobacteria bacterium]
MKNATEPVYLSVSDMAEDFTNVTGNKQYGQAAAMAYAIYGYKYRVLEYGELPLNRRITDV